MAALLNLILPLLFFTAIGLVIYAVILLVIAWKRRSKPLRIKALKLMGIPIIYILYTLIYFYIKSQAR
jgi:ABC-type Fe3+-siderophore transport system permease subunit